MLCRSGSFDEQVSCMLVCAWYCRILQHMLGDACHIFADQVRKLGIVHCRAGAVATDLSQTHRCHGVRVMVMVMVMVRVRVRPIADTCCHVGTYLT